MRKEVIKVGTSIDTLAGYMVVKHINVAGLCYCDEYTINEDGSEEKIPWDTMVTKADIAAIMYEVDGIARDVRIEREKDMNVKEIRDLTGLNRPQFSKAYGIPVRTLESWESGLRTAPPYVTALLERAVKADYQK